MIVYDCIQNVSRVCKYLHSFIENTSYIWTHFSFEEDFFDPFLFTSTNQLQSIFKHAKCFHCFDVPGICFENIFVASQFDTILNNSLISSSRLEWLDLSSAPVKSLDFLKGCPKLKTLVLGDCTLIEKESFENLSHCVNLCYLDAGFTQLNGETLAKSVPPSMVNLELCAVKFNMEDLQTVVLKCKKLLSIRIELESNVSIEEFNQFVRQYDVCFSLWQPHFWY